MDMQGMAMPQRLAPAAAVPAHTNHLCRQMRLTELKGTKARPTYSSLEFIRSTDFKTAVTDASHKAWVVVLLFKAECAPTLSACLPLAASLLLVVIC